MITESDAQAITDAGAAASQLAQRVRSDGRLDAGYAALAAGIEQLEASGLTVDALLPGDEETGLGFALRRDPSGRTFWQIYSQHLRASLCTKSGELHRAADRSLSAGTTALVVHP